MVSYTWQPVLSDQSTTENLEEGRLEIPIHYDKRYRINISVANRDVDDYLKKGRLAGNSLWELISQCQLVSWFPVQPVQQSP